jgi:hypothetical protein
MKKLVIILLLSSGVVTTNAQYVHHDLSGSYGFVTTDQIVDVFKDVLTAVFSFGNYQKEDYNYSGALFLTYKNAVTYKTHIGATIGIDNVTGDLTNNNIKYGDFRTNHTTMAIEGDIRWVKKNAFQLYSGIGLGYTFTSETGEISATGDTDTNKSGHVAFQINPLGMRMGKRLGAFAEIGFGYKGIANFGLSYQFE